MPEEKKIPIVIPTPSKPEAEIPRIKINEGWEKAQNSGSDRGVNRIPIDATPLDTPPPPYTIANNLFLTFLV